MALCPRPTTGRWCSRTAVGLALAVGLASSSGCRGSSGFGREFGRWFGRMLGREAGNHMGPDYAGFICVGVCVILLFGAGYLLFNRRDSTGGAESAPKPAPKPAPEPGTDYSSLPKFPGGR